MFDKLFVYRGKFYPRFIRNGDAGNFIFPFAQQFCYGAGLDIGGTPTCTLPGATAINISCLNDYDALHLPDELFDFIFSSHTIEHIPDYQEALHIWTNHLRPGGILFLYLPHPDMNYWHPTVCKKHFHSLSPILIEQQLYEMNYRVVLTTGRDLYFSFCSVGFLGD